MKTYTCKTTTDKELHFIKGLAKKREVKYKLFIPKTGKINALISFLPGCGMDHDSGYLDHLAWFVNERFGLAVALINYHGLGSRVATGAKVCFDEIDQMILKTLLDTNGLDLSIPQGELINPKLDYKDYSDEAMEKGCQNGDRLSKILAALPQNAFFSGTLLTRGDGYQNFGVLSCLDITNALLDAKKRLCEAGLATNSLRVGLFGSSHGAYLATLCAKISPFLINFVLENSGYASPPSFYICGKLIDYTSPAMALHFPPFTKGPRMHAFSKTFWNTNKYDPAFLSPTRLGIRDINDSLQTYAKFKNTVYIGHHYELDKIAPFYPKAVFYDALTQHGVDNDFRIYTDESKLDPPFTKQYSHGMKMSLKELLKRELQGLLDRASYKDLTSDGEFSIKYHFKDMDYEFFLKDGFYDLRVG